MCPSDMQDFHFDGSRNSDVWWTPVSTICRLLTTWPTACRLHAFLQDRAAGPMHCRSIGRLHLEAYPGTFINAIVHRITSAVCF